MLVLGDQEGNDCSDLWWRLLCSKAVSKSSLCSSSCSVRSECDYSESNKDMKRTCYCVISCYWLIQPHCERSFTIISDKSCPCKTNKVLFLSGPGSGEAGLRCFCGFRCFPPVCSCLSVCVLRDVLPERPQKRSCTWRSPSAAEYTRRESRV